MEPIEAHSNLFGVKVPPTERQKAFYSNTVARGFSSKERDPELTDATLICALAQVIDPSAKGVYNQVFLFFPEDQKPWVVSRIHNLAKTTMTRMQPVLKDERARRPSPTSASGWRSSSSAPSSTGKTRRPGAMGRLRLPPG